ncbi:MAG: histidine kinase [Gammaproteobacteria bacterium]|nr:MAG: histidine kinase [Gammaproteobacteria bacterium]
MNTDFAALSHIPLDLGTRYQRPPNMAELVHLDNPAVEVMTNFEYVHAVTTQSDISIDDALERMKTRGVRLLLVVDQGERVIGLVTAKDIQGEKPVKLAQESGQPRHDITVAMIMTPQEKIEALNMISVRSAQVGHIVETLNQIQRQHALVVEVDEKTNEQRICGMFSTSQISKQLGYDVTRDTSAAHSLAEISHELG